MVNDYNYIDAENEKVKRIVNAALKEISKNGLENTSLNQILRTGKIGKGVFYNYFLNKEELFNYLKYFVFNLNLKIYEDDKLWQVRDYIDRIILSTGMKFKYFEQYPYLFRYMERINLHDINGILNELGLEDAYDQMFERFMYENTDLSLIKDDIQLDMLQSLIDTTMAQIYNQFLYEAEVSKSKIDIEKMLKEMERYGDFIRKGYYK